MLPVDRGFESKATRVRPAELAAAALAVGAASFSSWEEFGMILCLRSL
jgi:hypothetical protein